MVLYAHEHTLSANGVEILVGIGENAELAVVCAGGDAWSGGGSAVPRFTENCVEGVFRAGDFLFRYIIFYSR